VEKEFRKKRVNQELRKWSWFPFFVTI